MQTTSNGMDFDWNTLEDLMKEADTFIYEVEHVESIKAQLDSLEWRSWYNDIFNINSPKIESIEKLIEIRDEGEDKKYISEAEIERLNEHHNKILQYQ